MSYEMKSLRKEDLSLYYHIKDVVLRDFVEFEEYQGLKLMPEMCGMGSYVYEYVSDLEPSPTERGRGWRYFDPPSGGLPCEPYPTVSGLNGDGDPAFGTPEQSYQIIVREHDAPILCNGSPTSSGTVLPQDEYVVDYIDGRIVAERELRNPTVSYHWHYVSVVDEWAAIEAADPPVIVIDMHGTDKMGYQLGGGKKAVRKVDIHVFASSPAERNDIVETLYDGLYLRSCPLYAFPTGTVLDYDGTFYGRKEAYDNKLTYLFDREKISNVSRLNFDSVTARHVNLPLVMSRGRDEVMLSDLNAYRSKVSFDMFSYDDRTTDRTYD